MPSEIKEIVRSETSEAAGAVDRIAELTERALVALDDRIEAFHAAVAAAEREVAAEVTRRSGEEGLEAEQALIELGPFAVGRIDPGRFARLLGVAEEPLTPEAIDVLDRADRILASLAAERSDHVVEVDRGGDLRDAVKDALTRFGRAYGAARAVELARAGTFDEEAHGHLLGALPFRLWHRAERELAPPLVVRVRGEDCLAAGLGEFLDGNVVLVLVVEGTATPAPLSRLVTPGTFVMQTADAADLVRVAEIRRPAVVLLFDEDRKEQAYFVHDPDAGRSPGQRLSIGQAPTDADVGRGRRAPRWLEELEHLRALASTDGSGTRPDGAGVSLDGAGASAHGPGRPPEGAGASADRVEPAAQRVGTGTDGGGATGAPADPVDRLAAWLLARTEPGAG